VIGGSAGFSRLDWVHATSACSCLSAFLVSATVRAQTPPPARGTAKPATFSCGVDDPRPTRSAPLSSATVTAEGPVSREGVTAPDGAGSSTCAQATTGALREGSITLERDPRCGRRISHPGCCALGRAPPPKAPEPVQPPLVQDACPGDPGDARSLFLEKLHRRPRRTQGLSLGYGNRNGDAATSRLRLGTRTTTRMNGSTSWRERSAAHCGSGAPPPGGTFSLVPHTVTHALVPQGRNPLIVISILSGPACRG
jgi:hypothetical protein